MDRVTNLKMTEIKKLVNEDQYEEALDVLNTIDISKFKTVKDLSLFAFIYEKNKHYMEAKNILLEIYNKNKTRRVIHYLVTIFIKMKYLEEAEKFYKEYLIIAPDDIDRFVLKYRLDKAANKPYDQLIKDLEELKVQEYMEEWSYELAKLYHKSGNKEKCIKECNDIVLWFGEGIIVEKAKLLKEYYLGDYETMDALCAKKQEKEDKTEEININQEAEGRTEETDINQEAEGRTEETDINQEAEGRTEETDINKEEENKIDQINISKAEENNTEIIKEAQEYDDINIKIEDTKLKNILGSFLEVDGLKEQIITVLENYSETNKHLIITGLDRCGKTSLAKKLLTAFFKMGYIKTAKIAKIESNKLNQLNLEEKYEKLLGRCLIVENAGSLSYASLEQLICLMNQFGEEIIVILEDKIEEMNQLILDNPELLKLIHQRIDIPEYGLEELINFVTESLLKEEYVLDEDAKIKLYEIGNKLIKKKKPEERLGGLFQVVNKGKELAEQRGILNLGKIAEKGDYEKLDLFKIKAEDLIFD
ncbi:hypothetical protein EDD66_101567 [Mobilisporobacter senegalensis]|uniref:Tetratricopeptide repeat protein n=1 Tax=Mobilisporobacter senegalensis TaxID=1329262 RepID=A0A3N1XZB3_9FIRM|nr:hypothetical protein [Mobilisporobacter senegalensis]ROR31946.1 hypothetical protein EDD66_101567 [Mobilisporobacter senegalensis]